MENGNFIIPEQTLLSIARNESINKFCIGAGIIKNGKVLLVRRSPDDFLGGLYEIPGGGVDPDESLEATLVREVYEETGLMVAGIIGMFEGFDYLSQSGKKTRQFNFAVAVEESEVVLAPEEHDHYLWVNKQDTENVELTPEIKKSLKSLFELFNLNNHVK